TRTASCPPRAGAWQDAVVHAGPVTLECIKQFTCHAPATRRKATACVATQALRSGSAFMGRGGTLLRRPWVGGANGPARGPGRARKGVSRGAGTALVTQR